jgi:hypothetical protein
MAAAISSKPTLVRIETNSAAIRAARSAYPSELSALSEDTPISAHPLSAAAFGPLTAPIMPPSAYTDFLRVAVASPTVRHGPFSASAALQSRTHLRVVAPSTGFRSIVSTPTSAVSPNPLSECSCKRAYESDEEEDDDDDDDDDDDISSDEDEDDEDDADDTIVDARDDDGDVELAEAATIAEDKEKAKRATTPVAEPSAASSASASSSTLALPTTPFTPQQPSSASSRPTSFPSLQIPPSPSVSASGASPRGSPMASPYSATFSATSPSFPYDSEMARIKAQMDPSARPSPKTVPPSRASSGHCP